MRLRLTPAQAVEKMQPLYVREMSGLRRTMPELAALPDRFDIDTMNRLLDMRV